MATFMPPEPPQPPPQPPQNPLTDFASNSTTNHQSPYYDGQAQQTMSPHSGQDHRSEYRPSLDFPRNGAALPTNSDDAMPVSKGPRSHLPNGGGRHRGTMSMGAFDGPRSPPNTKNTSHVPCKFFRLGQCQAGKACPFSHTLDNSTEEVCRYFQKGNCKFGQKCALAHVLPNGRRVNRPNGPVRGGMDLGGRIDPQLYRQSDPALAHSLLAQQANSGPSPFLQQMPPYNDEDRTLQIPQPRAYDAIPSIDTDFASPKYGSPTDGPRTAFSPSGYLGVLDAPLPASFDSQGISYIARHGPVAASVPSKFGLELSSPPSSVPQKAVAPSDATNLLQSSLAARRNPRSKAPDLGSSPLTSGDEGPSHRFMYSSRISKPKMLSASLPRAGMHTDDWDDGFHFSEGEETDYIPTSLHDQILTPQEKMRRLSRNDQDIRGVRESLSGMGTPGESSSKVGSPGTGSPSRYGVFFGRRQQENNSNAAGSPFGHVGSPLRNTNPGASPSLRATTNETCEMSPSFPSFASPPRQSSMSILSQQLSRTRLSSKQSDSNEGCPATLHPSSARHSSAPTATFSRTTSSSALGGTGRIDEEQGESVFSLEEEEEDRSKRHSGTNNNAWGTIGSSRAADWN
ncbi:MAG: hypothetical protein Q9217_006844 [Psora testacea]